ncbi:MAG: hypothetical protein MI865_12000 [Proteobacteria bacterium]|nr:hypothetical protein [Pseudomonadota bacterium]
MFYQSVYLILFAFFISSAPVFADHDGFEGHDHASKPRVDKPVQAADVSVSAGEAVIIVHGIVCSFCSQGVTRNLSRLSFIDNSRYTRGVKVEIEDQKVTIAIKEGSQLDLKQVYDSILDGGYEPIEAYVSDADGRVTYHKLKDS